MSRPEIILIDIDGTMTGYHSVQKQSDLSPLVHLENLVIKKYGLSRDDANKKICSCGDMEVQCLSEFLLALEIDPQDYFNVLAEDYRKYIYITDDTIRLFKYLKNKRIAVYTATTNSEFCTRIKLSLGGLADLESCPFLTGYCPGCMFKDPLGKYSPSYYPDILKHYSFDPETVMMIGDEPSRDMLPAMKAGIRYGVTIDRQQKEPLSLKDGGIYINSFDVLIELFENNDPLLSDKN